MIRAIFFDIDGTLVSFKTHRVHATTLEALAELRRRGVKLFICTGRHELLIDNIDTHLFDGIVSMNGQCVRIGGKTLYTNTIAPADVRNAVRYADEHRIAVICESIDFIRLNRVTPLAQEGAELMNLRLPGPVPLDDMHEYPVLQLIFFGTAEDERQVMRQMPSCISTRWTPLLCDIIARGGGKHIGIGHVLSHYGFAASECMAFGDGENDISMLRCAGVGVAMAGAHDEVKEAADYVTAATEDAGIWLALRHFGVL